ncbi:MAG: hypothetical protein HY648_01955 [Acidobacteria bacterium]|nr:hypothetical protein [Acidobacteriota bacterium]
MSTPAEAGPTPSASEGPLWPLRAKHPRFIYESYCIEQRQARLRFGFRFLLEPDIEFAPEILIEPGGWGRPASVSPAVLKDLVFHLGLVEMFSYWKAACAPEIVVRAGALNAEQIAWWVDLLRKGMAEYFYVNRIDFRQPGFVHIVASGKKRQENEEQIPRHCVPRDDSEKNIVGSGRDLVLTSGGKDSIVTLELLREVGREFDCLMVNPTEAALAVARQAGCARAIIVRRTIDPRLLELNKAGYLNGHTPFSALLAFLGVTVATLGGYSRVIVSNERSAEEATVEYLGQPINHQYSKTFEFERKFREYSRKYLALSRGCHPEPLTCIPSESEESALSARGRLREGSALPESAPDSSPAIVYFSLLRPLYELQIAWLFASYPAYFSIFRSCNRGMKENRWCGHCPKCMFVYTALYPFLEREQMLGIFGADLFSWEGAEALLEALLGLDASKPFECVGTKEETLAALYLCVQRYREQGIELPPALRTIEETTLSSRSGLPRVARSVLNAWTDQHVLPPELATALRQAAVPSTDAEI